MRIRGKYGHIEGNVGVMWALIWVIHVRIFSKIEYREQFSRDNYGMREYLKLDHIKVGSICMVLWAIIRNNINM